MSITLYKDMEVSEEDAVYVDPKVIVDRRLSFRSLVIYVYILGCDDDISFESIAKNIHVSPRTVYRSIIQLTKYGYFYESSDGVFYVGNSEQSAYDFYLENRVRNGK